MTRHDANNAARAIRAAGFTAKVWHSKFGMDSASDWQVTIPAWFNHTYAFASSVELALRARIGDEAARPLIPILYGREI